MTEHPTDFCAGPGNDQLVKVLNWMRAQLHLLHYASDLIPLAKQMQCQTRDPDVLYAKVDPLAPPKIYYDNEPSPPDSSDDGSDTETETQRPMRTQPTIKRRTTTSKFSKASSSNGFIRRTQSATESSDTNPNLKSSKSVSTIGYSSIPPIKVRSSRLHDLIITPHNPIGAVRDSRAELIEAALKTQLNIFGQIEAVSEERRAVSNMSILPRVAATLRMNPLDAIVGKPPPIFDYSPFPVDPSTSSEARIKELQEVVIKFLLMEPFTVAQEMTNIQLPYFLGIQVCFEPDS